MGLDTTWIQHLSIYSPESKFLCFILCPYPRPAPSPSPTVQPMTAEEAAYFCSDQWLIQHGRCGHCSFSRGQTGAIILNSQLDSLLTARALLMEKQRSAILFIYCQARVQVPNPLSQQAPNPDSKVRPSLKNPKTQFFGLG